jgi:L-ribulokinase
VTNLPLSVIGSQQGPALGSAIHAAVAAGAYPDIRAASAAMGSVRRDVYLPVEANVEAYQDMFEDYRTLHDYFGRGVNDVMHRLRQRQRARKGQPR